jgi:hypothetical protein
MRPRKSRVLTGMAIGLAFGSFVSLPWGAFSDPTAPGLRLALPAIAGFSILGAWIAYLTGLS